MTSTGTGTSDGNAPPLSLDTCFEILADEWRRHVLYYFTDTTSVAASVDELVAHLTRKVAAAATAGATRVKVRLLHRDLPKLAASGVIDYDAQDETVRYHSETTLDAAVAFAARRERST